MLWNKTAKIAAETDLRIDWLLGSEVLYPAELSFIIILEPR